MEKLVKNLIVGERIKLPRNKNLVVVVREHVSSESKVRVSKETATLGHGIMSISYFSSNYDDCQNRVFAAIN